MRLHRQDDALSVSEEDLTLHVRSISSSQPESALLVGAKIISEHIAWSLEDSLEELALLAKTAGLDVVESISQTLQRVNPATYVGKGKLQEIRELLSFEPVEVAVFDFELSPTQQRNLEEYLDIRIIDRTALILDIFARHARSREGMLQRNRRNCPPFLHANKLLGL